MLTTSALATTSIPAKFTGKERDAETGLDYFGARYMSSAQGRFTSPDPKNPMMNAQMMTLAGLPGEAAHAHMEVFLENPQNWNRYVYVRNNPLGFIDPFGNAPVGHHLIPLRGQLSGLAAEFANSIVTGPPNVDLNKGYGVDHRQYSAAVEQLMEGFEQEFRVARNAWSVSQWRDAATRILNSNVPAIRNFLDTFNRNQGGGAITALTAAIKGYRPSFGLLLRTAIGGLGQDVLNLFRLPLIVMVDPVGDNQRYKEQIMKSHANCLVNRDTGNCVE